jgi:hypothetical protein
VIDLNELIVFARKKSGLTPNGQVEKEPAGVGWSVREEYQKLRLGKPIKDHF